MLELDIVYHLTLTTRFDAFRPNLYALIAQRVVIFEVISDADFVWGKLIYAM